MLAEDYYPPARQARRPRLSSFMCRVIFVWSSLKATSPPKRHNVNVFLFLLALTFDPAVIIQT